MICLTGLVLLCYGEVWDFDFVNIDDPAYVLENRHVKAGLSFGGIHWALTTFEVANWHPLTWISLMADTQIFGPGPRGHHITNVLLHLANTLLLFGVFMTMTGAPKRSAILAALFAVHPLHVESVAWISERKDVLSTFFGLLSMGCYARYARTGCLAAYGLCMLSLCLGLMSKPLLVTWPCLFLLLDFWPLERFTPWGDETLQGAALRHRIQTLVIEKLPLMVPVVLACQATLAAQRYWGAVIAVNDIDLKTRIANALVSYGGYLAKAIWPAHLSVYYPYPVPGTLFWPAAGSLLVLALITGLAIGLAKRAPCFPVGWFWFLGVLVPMIGLVQVGDQAMADRYMYVPLIGLGIVAIWGGYDLFRGVASGRRAAFGIVLAVIVAFSVVARRQVGHWRNSQTLFSHAVALNPNNDFAHNNLGAAYQNMKDTEKAALQYRKALALDATNGDAANNLANFLSTTGNFEEAERLYRQAIDHDFRWPAYRYNYGLLLFQLGRTEEAVAQFAEVLKLDPNNAMVYNYMGVALSRQGKRRQAMVFFKKAVEVDPTFTPAQKNMDLWQNR